MTAPTSAGSSKENDEDCSLCEGTGEVNIVGHGELPCPECISREFAAYRASHETSDARDAARYRYLRERVPFDRLIARRRRINEHGTTVYETLQGPELDREIDECSGASEKAKCGHGNDPDQCPHPHTDTR